MHESESNSQHLNREIQEWRKKAMEVQKSISNKEIKNILEKIKRGNHQASHESIKSFSDILLSSAFNLSSGTSKSDSKLFQKKITFTKI